VELRLANAGEALRDAAALRQANSVRGAINRAYYAMFYAVLALFLKMGINARTSKHAGVIAMFDKEFIHTGKLDVRCSNAVWK